MSLKPDGVPVSEVLAIDSRWSLSVSSCRISATERNVFWRSSCATSRTERSARSSRSRAGASRDGHAGLDLVGGREQRTEPGVVADDPAVVTGVAGGGHPAGEFVDRRRAAELLELAALAERLGDRQVVDLVVALVELDHRREHLAVLLAVEVLGPQVLLDQQPVQVPLVQQHRAEHRLLGLEVVRRNGDVLDGAHGSRPKNRCGSGGGGEGSRNHRGVRRGVWTRVGGR